MLPCHHGVMGLRLVDEMPEAPHLQVQQEELPAVFRERCQAQLRPEETEPGALLTTNLTTTTTTLGTARTSPTAAPDRWTPWSALHDPGSVRVRGSSPLSSTESCRSLVLTQGFVAAE